MKTQPCIPVAAGRASTTPEAADHINTGIALAGVGKFQEALDCYNKAIALDPGYAIAYVNRAFAYVNLGDWQAMAADLNRAKELDPANADIHHKIGVMLFRGQDHIQALPALTAAVHLRPEFEDAWIDLADCYYRIGSMELARKLYEEAGKKFPGNKSITLELAYMLPNIPFSQAEIDLSRSEFMQNLDRLMQAGFTFSSPDDIRYLPFYQAYHGRNNKELAKKLADFFYKTCPALTYIAPHALLPRAPKAKIRIGIVWDFLFKNFDQFWLSMIEGMALREDMDVVLLIANAAPEYPGLTRLTERVKTCKILPREFAASRDAIAAEKCDILVYMEIGMSAPNYFLAMARLAPIQCLGLGHPVTTGIATMDYFLSSALHEPENASEHYSEKLVLFERTPAIFKRPDVPTERLSRDQLGLPPNGHVYCCPVMLFKLHPDMDAIFARILERDPTARIVLFDSKNKTLWRSQLEKRFAACMTPQQCARIVFLPFAPKEQFFQILLQADAILDTVHFSFGTTAYLALGANLPFVTWEGEFYRGRQSYGLYNQMGVMDLVAKTHEEYVELALRLANDKPFRAKMAKKIRRSSNAIFDDYAIINAFAEKMKELYARAFFI